jgi:hypothetical protein
MFGTRKNTDGQERQDQQQTPITSHPVHPVDPCSSVPQKHRQDEMQFLPTARQPFSEKPTKKTWQMVNTMVRIPRNVATDSKILSGWQR